MNFKEYIDPAIVRSKHEEWANQFESKVESLQLSETNSNLTKLSLGVVSPDFKQHPVAQFFEPILKFLDRSRFNLFCYSAVKDPDVRTKQLVALSENWIDISSMSDDSVADRILRDKIDILIDLSGHTLGSRPLIFALKPARVQASYLGYPCTTGMSSIDFKITDHLSDPDNMGDRLYTEKLVRISKCGWCYAADASALSVKTDKVVGEAPVVFGSFNRHNKISDSILKTWSRILREVPESKLYLKSKSLRDPLVSSILINKFEQNGISGDRLLLKGWSDFLGAHFAEYNRVDIALDTFPYHGTITTCEALYQGVPVVSLAGQTHVSRVGVSLLTNVGLEDLIAESEKEYIEKAVELAGDRERLTALRKKLRPMMEASPLMDGPGFAKRFGEAMEHMYEMKCEC